MMTFADGVPGWASCPGFFHFAVERAPAVGRFVEVGVLFGSGSQQIAKAIRASGKKIQLVMIDSFEDQNLGARARKQITAVRHSVWSLYGEVSFRNTFNYYKRGRAHAEPPHEVLVRESLEAAKGFDTQSLDLVFLDNNHSTEHVLQELVAWGATVRPGGLLCGKWAGVIDGVFTPHEDIVRALDTHYGQNNWQRCETAWYVIAPSG